MNTLTLRSYECTLDIQREQGVTLDAFSHSSVLIDPHRYHLEFETEDTERFELGEKWDVAIIEYRDLKASNPALAINEAQRFVYSGATYHGTFIVQHKWEHGVEMVCEGELIGVMEGIGDE